eukprot:6721889-Pyramimonas_sp.AAC.1
MEPVADRLAGAEIERRMELQEVPRLDLERRAGHPGPHPGPRLQCGLPRGPNLKAASGHEGLRRPRRCRTAPPRARQCH